MEGLGKTKAAQFNALGNIEAAKLGAEAKAHAAAASADATRSNAMMGMFGSIAGAGIGAIGSAGGYSGTGSASSKGSDINPSTGKSFQHSVDQAISNYKPRVSVPTASTGQGAIDALNRWNKL